MQVIVNILCVTYTQVINYQFMGVKNHERNASTRKS